ncbi:hypothetical protein PSP20601_05065 [Pandoraea sputorum]|nr:hypothetical protein PSP20601_05065 [Pandoraea sputorum]
MYTAESTVAAVQRVKQGPGFVVVGRERGMSEQTLRNWLKTDAEKLALDLVQKTQADHRRFLQGCPADPEIAGQVIRAMRVCGQLGSGPTYLRTRERSKNKG